MLSSPLEKHMVVTENYKRNKARLKKVAVLRYEKYQSRTTLCGFKTVQSESAIRHQECHQGWQEQPRT